MRRGCLTIFLPTRRRARVGFARSPRLAGDWLKLEYTTPEKPEIFAIAKALNVSIGDALLLCIRVWRWFDANTETGNAPSVTGNDIDTFVGRVGVTLAMKNVGWMRDSDYGLQIPHFDYHMSESGKKRALTQKRVRRLRLRNAASVTNVTLRALPEKRREDIKDTPLPPVGGNVCAEVADATNGELRRAIVETWKLTDNADTARRIDRLVGKYARAGANHLEIPVRWNRAKLIWSKPAMATPEAVAKRWGELCDDSPYRPPQKKAKDA